MERRSSKEYLVVFYTERQKVQVTKFAFEDSIIEDLTPLVKNILLTISYSLAALVREILF